MTSEKDPDHRSGTDDSAPVPQSESAQQENAPTSSTDDEVTISKATHGLTDYDILPARSFVADDAAESDSPASQKELYPTAITPNPPKDDSPKVSASATEETTSNTVAIPQEDGCDHDEPSSQKLVGSEPASPTDKTKASELPPSELYVEFLKAAEEGDEDKIQILLPTPNLDVNFKNDRGDAALHKAAKNGHLGVVKKLLQRSAFVKIHDGKRRTRLSRAYRNSYLDLWGREVDVDARDAVYWTPLHWASYCRHLDIVKELLRHSADSDAKTDESETPLHLATQGNALDVVRELLIHLCDINAANNDDQTPLHQAARNGYTDIVKELLAKGADINAADNDDQTPLYQAARNGYTDIVKELLANGANINAANNDDQTPLHQAARNGYTDIVKELLANGASIKARNWFGQTPLHIASNRDHLKVAEELLKSGADINEQDGDGWTPLFGATTLGNPDMVQFLLDWQESVADIGIQSFEGMTPLYEAAKWATVQRRRDTNETRDQEDDRDADKEEENDGNEEFYGEGKRDSSYYKEVMRHLLNKMKEDDKEKELVRMASREKDNKLWSFVFENIEWTNPSVKRDTEKRINLIWLAASKQYPELKMLLQTEASVDPSQMKATDNYNVLQWAAYLGRNEIVWWLVRNRSFDKRDRDEALKVAKAQRDNLSQDDSTMQKDHTKDKFRDNSKTKNKDDKREVQEPELGLERKASKQPTREKYTTMMNILKNPPFIEEGKELDTVFEKPKCPEAFKKRIAGHFDATIVDFYSQDRRIDFLCQSREVVDVIYGKGPDKIMKDAMDTLAQISPDAVKETEDLRKNFCFRWIHLPANSLDWMMDLTTTLYLEKKERAQYNGAIKFFQKSCQDLRENSSHAPYMRPCCLRETVGSEISTKVFTRVALYMPYLNFGTYHCNNIQLGANSGETDNPPLWKAKDEWVQETYKNRAYRSRTLDQFYYSSVENTDSRDRDQIVTKYIDKITHRHPEHRGNSFEVLQVDDLWLWIIDDKTVITSSTHRNDDKDDIILEEVLKHLREHKTRVNGEIPPSSVQEMSELITWYCIKFHNHLTWKTDALSSHNISEDQIPMNGFVMPETLKEKDIAVAKTTSKSHNAKEFKASASQMFADTLNDMSDKETRLLGDFVKKVRKKLGKLKLAERSQEIGSLGKQNEPETKPSVSNTDSKSDRVKSRFLEETSLTGSNHSEIEQEHCANPKPGLPADDGVLQKQDYESIHRASDLLVEVKDIRDELGILRFLLQQQKTVWDRLLTAPSMSNGQIQNATCADGSRKTSQSRDVGQLILDIEEMEKTARRIHDSINSILSLEQNEASLSEAEEARRLTEATIQQGRTLMAFTIVTILFLPLSFLTSLFALNVTIFPHQGTNLQYGPGWIFPAIFAPAVGFSAIVIIIAFYIDKFKKFMEQLGLSRLNRATSYGTRAGSKLNSSQSRPPNETSTSKDPRPFASRGRSPKRGNPLKDLGSAVRNRIVRRDGTMRAQQESVSLA